MTIVVPAVTVYPGKLGDSCAHRVPCQPRLGLHQVFLGARETLDRDDRYLKNPRSKDLPGRRSFIGTRILSADACILNVDFIFLVESALLALMGLNALTLAVARDVLVGAGWLV